MSQVQRPPRRRLFTRRELRHRGTHIVRVGSVNIVQSAQGPYSFAAVAQRYNSSEASQDGSAPPPNEPIEAFSQRSSSAERHERAEDIIDSDLLEGRSPPLPPPMRRLTHVAQHTARKLVLSPTKRRTQRDPQHGQRRQDAVVLVSSDSEGDENGDRDILSHHRTPPAKRQIPPPAHLTPLRLVCDRLRPKHDKRTPFRTRPLPPPLYDFNQVRNVNSIRTRAKQK